MRVDMKEDILLAGFIDQLNLLMPEIIRGFGRNHFGDMLKTEISMPQVLAMEYLLKNTSVKMTDIARILGISTAAATGIVDRMVKKGYLRRKFDVDDRRIIRVELTSKGEEMIAKISSQRRKMFTKVFSRVSQEDRKNYLRILNKVRDILVSL
jgi:DNA-binding MarR family transcriptional regulator